MSTENPDECNTIYIIICQGVYRHDIWGPYDSLEEAQENADAIASEDMGSHSLVGPDDYHLYEVYKLSGHLPDNATSLYSVRHSDVVEEEEE